MTDRSGPAAERLAIVTGTSRGVGAALASQLVERGWTVVGIARHPAAIEHAAYRHLLADLADTPRLAPTLEQPIVSALAGARCQRVALVNNAATSGALAPLEMIDPVACLRVSALNWVAPIWLMGAVLRHAPRDAAVRIVNVSSGAAIRAFPGLADYCGSKAALRMSGMAVAAELESKHRPNPPPSDVAILSYEPGTVDTAMQEEARSRPLDEYPWGRLFRDFHARGALVPPAAPAREIVAFLESASSARFTERRLAT